MTDSDQRTLRADARENHGRLLRAAARAFARDGTQASLKGIAQDAGVGIATLYRRFPTREQLVEATYRSEVDRVAASLRSLLEAGAQAGVLRDDVDAFDVLLGLGGISVIAGTTEQASHAQVLVDLLIDGLRYRDGD